jgi:5'-methylthioadenosine phosphorylase
MIAIIGGTGVYALPGAEERERAIATPYGDAAVTEVLLSDGGTLVFAARHGKGHAVPPHRLPARALIWGLKEIGVTALLATSAVGSLHAEIPPGSLALLGDFMDFTKARPTTFHDGPGVVHQNVSDAYCPTLRAALRRSAERQGIALAARDVVYVCTEGPRFETPAEIRAYGMLGGDVVGMTQVPEAVLAAELGICYAAVALVTNLAAGVQGARPSHEEVLELMASQGRTLSSLLLGTVQDLGQDYRCSHHPQPEGIK